MTEELWSARRTSFGSAADAYAAGRPSYADGALDWVVTPAASRALDLAAGTGRLTEQLLARGLDVVAVEPSDEMRAHVPTAAEALAGTAEDIPLGDGSVDLVVVGQAFHWFDAPRALTEIRRVLRPGGVLGLFWNLLDDRDPFAARLADLVDAEDRASAGDPDAAPPYSSVDGLSDPQRRLFHDAPAYDVERLLAFAMSRSHTILLPEAEREALLGSVRELCPAGSFALPLVCEAWRGERV